MLAQGQIGGPLAVVLTGGLKETLTDEDGKAHLLHVRGRGDLIGATSYLHGAPQAASFVALRDVEMLWVPVQAFSAHLAARPESGTALARSVAQRLIEADRFRVECTSESMERRVVSALLRLAESFYSGTFGEPVQVPVTQAEVAQYAEVSSITVSRVLRALRSRGLVRSGYAELVLPCPPCLLRVADWLRTGLGGVDSVQGCPGDHSSTTGWHGRYRKNG